MYRPDDLRAPVRAAVASGDAAPGPCRSAAWAAAASMLVVRLVEGWAARPPTLLGPTLAWVASGVQHLLAPLDGLGAAAGGAVLAGGVLAVAFVALRRRRPGAVPPETTPGARRPGAMR